MSDATCCDGYYKIKSINKLYNVQFFLKEAPAFCHLSGADDCVFAQRLRARWVKGFLLIVFYTLMPSQQCSAAVLGPVFPYQGFGVQFRTQTSSRLNSVTVTG